MNLFDAIYGVDFSGARAAGENTWVARCTKRDDGTLVLESLDRLGALAGSDERGIAIAHLVELVRRSERALWGIDFPFALPCELGLGAFDQQLAHLATLPDDATAFGRWCVARALTIGPTMHVRRKTDLEARTPFDCYHYRIIHQTFQGMRRLLTPLRADRSTCIFPFDAMEGCARVVVEACPSSTLKRLGLPHQNYKKPKPPLEPKHRRVRRELREGLARWVRMDERFARVVNRNSGGDALDAVIAAVGVWNDVQTVDARSIRCDARYPLEGRISF